MHAASADATYCCLFISAASREGKAAAIRLDSVVMTDNLVTILEREIDSELGRLPDIAAVDRALKHTLDL
jgi:mRNA interferase MazF